jgi:hypothetical protein
MHNDITINDIEVNNEALRQERICFDDTRLHFNRWIILKLIMGYSALAILVCIMSICGFVVFNYSKFNDKIILCCIGVLFTDIVGLMITVYKIVLRENNLQEFKPITKRK